MSRANLSRALLTFFFFLTGFSVCFKIFTVSQLASLIRLPSIKCFGTRTFGSASLRSAQSICVNYKKINIQMLANAGKKFKGPSAVEK